MTEPQSTRRAVLGALAAAAAVTPASALPGFAEEAPMIFQLRIYEIFEANKAAFHVRFRDHAAPIMARHGFDIAAMWEARGERGPCFVYLLRWPDEATLTARWASFMADPEWARIKDETAARDGQMVGAIQNLPMRLVDYSGRI